MHPEVSVFLRNVNLMNGTFSLLFKLDLIKIRIGHYTTLYKLASFEKRKEHREIMQQLMDLFGHIYENKPISDFHEMPSRLNVINQNWNR